MRVVSLLLTTSLLAGCGPLSYVTPSEYEDRVQSLDEDGDGVTKGQNDCNDLPSEGGEHETPGADEIPYDGWDNDCADGDLLDQDGDGYAGVDKDTYLALDDDPEWNGDPLAWPASLKDDLDCNDSDPSVNPGARDTAYDGIDSDCDCAHDFDYDSDGYVLPEYWDAHQAFVDSLPDCTFTTLATGDCNDQDADVFPGNGPDEWYDGRDTDCARNNDFDRDGDGFMHADTTPSEFQTYLDLYGYNFPDDEFGDCEDVLSIRGVEPDEIYPGAPDAWYDGVDADCAEDDDFDADLDGWIPSEYLSDWSTYTLSTYDYSHLPTPGSGDCDDTDELIHPEVLEYIGDDIDQNCDGGKDTTEWNFSDYTWEHVLRPHVDADGVNYGLVVADITTGPTTDFGWILHFDMETGATWDATPDDDYWWGSGTGSPDTLHHGLDLVGGTGWFYLGSSFFDSTYTRTRLWGRRMNWQPTGEYYNANGGAGDIQLTPTTEDYSIDLQYDTVNNLVWTVGCGEHTLHAFVHDFTVTANKSAGADSTLCDASCTWLATACVFESLDPPVILTTNGTSMRRFLVNQTGSALTFTEDFPAPSDGFTHFHQRHGWLIATKASGGVALVRLSDHARYDVLGGTTVYDADAMFIDADGDGDDELYLLVVVDDQDGDGYRDAFLKYGDPAGPAGTVVLPLTDGTDTWDVEYASLYVDEDRLMIAAASEDHVGWLFMGWGY